MIKAANHRKRHVPPGPCGIWFQAQQQMTKAHTASSSSSALHSSHSTSGRQRRNANHPLSVSNGNHASTPSSDPDESSSRAADLSENVNFSSAWTLAQQELNLILPYLPPNITDPAAKHRHLRLHAPCTLAFLYEMERGDHDMLNGPRRPPAGNIHDDAAGEAQTNPSSKSILVLVTNVESHIHNNIWTVELKDETGTMNAWLEPALVQRQLQEHQTIIRPGVVWKVDQVGMIYTMESAEKLQRMLLIRESSISQVWTPEQGHNSSSSSNDSSSPDTRDRQEAFLRWMEQRKAIRLQELDCDDNDDEEDMPEMMDDEVSNAQHLASLPRPRELALGDRGGGQEEGEEEEEEEEGDLIPRSTQRSLQFLEAQTTMTASQASSRPSTQLSQSRSQRIRPAPQSRIPTGESCNEDPPIQPVATIVDTPAPTDDRDSGRPSLNRFRNTPSTGATATTQVESIAKSAARGPVKRNDDTGSTTSLVPPQTSQPTLTPMKKASPRQQKRNEEPAPTQNSQKSRKSQKKSSACFNVNDWDLPATSNADYWDSMIGDDDDDDEDVDDGSHDVAGSEIRKNDNRKESSEPQQAAVHGDKTDFVNGAVVEKKDEDDEDSDADYLGIASTAKEAPPSLFSMTDIGKIDIGLFGGEVEDDDDD